MGESLDTEPILDDRYFKFRKINKHLIDSLVNSRLWFAKPNALNDPFDCQLDLRKSWERAAASSTGRRKNWLQSALDNPIFLEQWGIQFEKIGVCSFSRDLCNSQMWSHYADEHRGACLLYRFPKSFRVDPQNKIVVATWVNYAPNALTDWLKNDAPMELLGFIKELTKIYLSAKGPGWEYENEARIIREEHGPFNVPFGFLQKVCFGLRTPPADIDLVKKLASKYCGCEKFCRIVRDDKSDFGIKEEEM